MAVQQINIYFAATYTAGVLINNQPLNFTLGYIDNTGALNPISNTDPDLSINIIEPINTQLIDNNIFLLVSTPSSVTLRFSITYQGFIQYFSYVIAPPYPFIGKNDLLNRLNSLLPQNVYNLSINSNNQIDNIGAAAILNELYNSTDAIANGFYSLSEILNIIYPSSGALGWEYFLTGNNRLLFQNSTQYGLLMQHIYSYEINNNTNPYWLAFNISKYIYLWLKKQRFVYTSENVFSIGNAFILDKNKLSYSMFIGINNNSMVTFYVLTDNPDGSPALTTEEQQQITRFITQINRAGVGTTVDYTHSTSDFNLTYLGNTYYTDPRQNQSYCIAYNQNILSQALGYSGSANSLFNLISYELVLVGSSGSVTFVPSTESAPIVNTLSMADGPYFINQIIPTPTLSGINFFKYIQFYALTDWNNNYPLSSLVELSLDTVSFSYERIDLLAPGNFILKTYLGPCNNYYYINVI